MTDRVISDRSQSDACQASKPTPARNNPKTLNDSQYIAHALIESFRLFISLALKRWPELR